MPVERNHSSAISWTPSTLWDGNDGSWNSFIVQVGTPPQAFRVLPSTAGQELWIPLVQGCTSISPGDTQNCGYERGALSVNGVNSSGFATNDSSTWKSNGIFTLSAQQQDIGYGGNGLYGFDTVSWGVDNNSITLSEQVVAGVADPVWWLGQVGLVSKTINFTTFNDPIQSFMGTLYNESILPSHSFGYTAGAAHRNNSPASLTLGGYDSSRLEKPGLSLPMGADNSRQLQVGVRRILASNTLDDTVNLLPTATYHLIDSSVPHIWLPEDSINAFVSAFGLTYDNATDLFLINDTMRARMRELNPIITFVLGDIQGQVAESVSIDLPYKAFDLQASYPFYENATNYFPIRRAANDSQYTIGRTFLQEAYIIADFDHNNFTIARARFDNIETKEVVDIQAPSQPERAREGSENAKSGLSGGAIAGIVIGAVAILATVGFCVWFLVFRKRQKRKKHNHLEAVSKGSGNPQSSLEDAKPGVFTVHHKSELPSENNIHEAEAKEPMFEAEPQGRVELETTSMQHEMDGGSDAVKSPHELQASPVPHEMPGSQGVRQELEDNSISGRTRL